MVRTKTPTQMKKEAEYCYKLCLIVLPQFAAALSQRTSKSSCTGTLRKPNAHYSCHRTTCKVVCGPFKLWSLQCALSSEFRHQRVNHSTKIKTNTDWGRSDSTKCTFFNQSKTSQYMGLLTPGESRKGEMNNLIYTWKANSSPSCTWCLTHMATA